MESFVYKERKPLNLLTFFLSILFLFGIFWIYLSLRPILSDPQSYEILANLRSITEEGKFFSWSEPIPVFTLYLWKALLGMNYLTSFQSLSALLFSINLHLLLLLFRKSEWKINHHFLVFLSAFLPFSHEFPILYFSEMFGLTFILLLFHTFRMETILDLLLFPCLLILAFFSDLRMFLLGFTIFIIWEYYKATSLTKSRTTVFYKKKNIPFIILISYFSLLTIVLIVFSIIDFFSDSSFFYLIVYDALLLVYLLPAILTLVIGNILLGTEKELNTRGFTIVIVVSILGIIYFNYTRYDSNKIVSLESKKEDFIRGQSLRTGYNTIYSDPSTAHYLYFSTKQKHIFYNAELRDENSLLFVNDIWQADIVEINKKFPTRRRERRIEIIPIGKKSILINLNLQKKILNDSINSTYKRKLQAALNESPKLYNYNRYMFWLQKIFK